MHVELRDPVLASEAPAAVLATFGRGGRNFQRIHDPTVAASRLPSGIAQRVRRQDQ